MKFLIGMTFSLELQIEREDCLVRGSLSLATPWRDAEILETMFFALFERTHDRGHVIAFFFVDSPRCRSTGKAVTKAENKKKRSAVVKEVKHLSVHMPDEKHSFLGSAS